MSGLHKSKIDYLALSESATGRPGYVLNICTGCKHTCGYCYARDLVERGRLKGSPSYPYGFEPTFHPERIQKIGGKPKLIFLNDMGDVGGDWDWKNVDGNTIDGISVPYLSSKNMASLMKYFAELNPQHILLLLTKRPEWYNLVCWPENCMKGFTACNNKELDERWEQYKYIDWVSCEPWLDSEAPNISGATGWLTIGGLSGKHPRPVSKATMDWLLDKSVQAKRFAKENIFGAGNGYLAWQDEHIFDIYDMPREYPASWRTK